MADDYTPTTDAVRGRIHARDGFGFWGLEEFNAWLAAHDAAKRAEWEAEQGEVEWGWQWCYVEKWADGSGVYERVTFDTLERASRYFRANAERLTALNAEVAEDEHVVASIEKRRVFAPGEWVPVNENGEHDADPR